MHAIQTIRVVLGEGQPGLLRLVLEAQGFEVVGHARDDDELLRILDVTTPTVVVLDAGISALAASAVEVRTGGTPIVVVWPRDVFTSLAAERVEPSNVILELGNAVRRAAGRRPSDEPIRIPDLATPPPVEIDVPVAPAGRDRPKRAKRHVFVAAAAWVVSLSALGAIGMALPRVLDPFERHGGRRPAAVERADGDRVADRERAGSSPTGTPHGGRGARGCSPDRSADPEPGRGKGCGKGQAKQEAKGHGPKPGKGRPDDAGRGSAKEPPGHANGPNGPKDEREPDDGSGSSRGSGGGNGGQGQGQGGRAEGSSADDSGATDPPGAAKGKDGTKKGKDEG